MMKKAQGAMVGTVVLLIVGIILMVAVLVPITQNLSTSAYYFGADGTKLNASFSGVNATIAGNLVTFIMIGVILMIVGGLYMKYRD